MSSRSSDNRTNRLVFTSLTACLVLLGTILFRIPIPMTQGYVHLGEWSFFIKFAMAFTAGAMIEKRSKIISMTAGGLVMCAGYLIAERIMYGSWALAAVGLPWNIGQFAVGIAVALAAQPLFRLIPVS